MPSRHNQRVCANPCRLTSVCLGLLFLLCTAVSFISGTGCANYHLGSNTPLPFASLQVLPVANDTFAPQAQALLHQQLIDSLVQEKSIRLDTTGGQASLQVRLVKYDQTVSSTRSDDTVLGSTYTLTLLARCTLTDNRTGKTYFADREIRATADTHATDGYNATEYQTMPILTRELARKIKDAVVGVW